MWAIAMSEDGQFLAATSLTGQINVWNIDSGELVRNYETKGSHGMCIDLVSFVFKELRAPVTDDDDGKSDSQPTAGSLRPGMKTAGSSSSTTIPIGYCILCQVRQQPFLHACQIVRLISINISISFVGPLSGLLNPVRTVAFSPMGKFLAAAGDSKVIAIYDTQAGEQVANLFGHTGWITSLSWNSTGERLLSV